MNALRLPITLACWLALTVAAQGGKVTVEIAGGDNVTFVGAFQRWDQDGLPTKKVNTKAKIEVPEVDAAATKSGSNQWVFNNLKPGKYDLVILAGDKVRIEGWEYAPMLEFDPFFPPTATASEENRDFVFDDIKKSPHYENKVEPLYCGGDDKAIRVLVMLIRDKTTSYEGDFPGAATMRFEIWQYTWQYGAFAKEKRTRVMHRVILHRDELRKWTWLWDPKLGAIEVGARPMTVKVQMPKPTDKKLKGLYPY